MSGNIDFKCSLEDMLRRASDMAEEMFDHDGEVTMFWLAETSSGEQLTLVTPVVIPEGVSPAEAKHMMAGKIREFFREQDVVRYGLATEGWTAPDGSYPPSEHPQREEIISVTANNGIEFLSAVRDIIRPRGAKAYLGQLSEITRTEYPTGRLTNLLSEVRPSSELPDDEGTVFVTHIPGEALSVVGRRGRTGELFVGSAGTLKAGMTIEQMCRAVEADISGRPEVVTGREAERLVAAVKRAMGPPKH
jgi:hypothetical protein